MPKKLANLFGAVLWIISMIAHASASTAAKPSEQVRKANADIVSAANQYKKSVQALISHYEDNLKSANEALEKRKELFARGLVAKRDLETGEQAVKDAQTQLEQSRKQIAETDQLIAEANAEMVAPSPSKKASGYTARAAIMRYSGAGGWAISQATKVESFYASTLGKQLPISAYGQSATHNRLGFDHHNSIDVAVHPDSAEGKSLIDYLRSNGIPYLAFRSAIPGVATGAHIHIGYPSHRTSG
jgi:hypothetical protein